MGWLFFFLVILIMSSTLTWLLRQYIFTVGLVDVPNSRSSHTLPTPRGGGISFVICFLIGLVFLAYSEFIDWNLFAALAGAGALVALLGFLDDRSSVPPRWRLLGHFFAATLALYCLGGMPTITLLSWTLYPSMITSLLALFYLVWLLNLFNFMDGIDGIAAVEAISICLGAILFYVLQGNFHAAILPACLAFAVGGFLIWNFPPASIFMGDVGSGFLGIVLGILSIQGAAISENFFWGWLILLGVFVVDATITLIYRALQRETLSQAHCNHAYQHAARYYGKHFPITMGVAAINLLWLLPIAVVVSLGFIKGVTGVLIAYLPLIGLALKFKAGKRFKFLAKI